MASENARDRLVEHATGLFHRDGFHAVGGAAVVGGVVWAVGVDGGGGGKAAGPLPSPVAYGSSTTLPPWPAPADGSAGAKAAGLKVSAMEGTVNHFHSHLDVIVDGNPRDVTVPEDEDVQGRALIAVQGVDLLAQPDQFLPVGGGGGVVGETRSSPIWCT
ncbi:hypothetical protein [Streptomyces sp. NPDC005498]|uniref:hypothetical protein n=1 Tax=Streptomyces sp. NPDC005498 TaxID=3364717 RepID=UPI00369C7EFB